MSRSPFAASALLRGAHRFRWLLLASLLLPLTGVKAGMPPAPEPAWPPKAGPTPIGPGEAHSWPVDMAAGDFLGAVVEQDGIDVVIELFDPQGKLLFQADSTEDWEWEEELSWEAEQPGRHRLTVRPLDPKAAPGSYRIRVDGPRPIRPEDRLRVQAVQEMGAALAALGHRERRLPPMERALALWRELGDRRREAEVLHQIGAVLGDLSRDQEALERFSQALALWQELGVPTKQAWAEAMTLYYQARLHLKQDPRKAFGYLSKALPLIRQARQARPELQIVYHLGYVCDDLAEKQDAIQYFGEALRIARRLHAYSYEANALNSLGLVYFTLGHPERASQLCQQAVDLSREKKLTSIEASALNNLALIYTESNPAQARDYYHRTLTLGREVGDPELQATALNNLAFLENQTGNPARALELGREALALGVPNMEVVIRHAIGVSLRKRHDLEASRRELTTALDLSRERQDRVRESLVLPELARTVRAQGDLRGALHLLKSGIAVVESIRTEVAEEDLRASFFASRQDVYGLITDILMSLHETEPGVGYDAEALRSSEQARARSLLDILSEAGADVREGADPSLLKQERRLRAEIEEVETKRLKLLGSGSAATDAERRLTSLLEEHRKVNASLRASSPRYAALTQPEPLSVAGIRSELLDGRALLLEYALGEERSFLWAVTPDGLQSFVLPPRARIEDAARLYYQALSVHPDMPKGQAARAGLQKAADELSRMLLRPVEGLLAGQPLLVVSDGALQYVPFGSLPAPSSLDRPKRVLLVESHDVASLPSASVLAVLRHESADRPTPPKILAVFADPVFQPPAQKRPSVAAPRAGRNLGLKTSSGPRRRGLPEELRAGESDLWKLPRLPFAEQEALAIATLVPVDKRFVALRHQASRAAVTGLDLTQYRMVHFATHGLIDSRNPELSSLVLSLVDENGKPQNGFLRLHDIYNLKLNADLVVLSACRTALGQEIRGEGLVGLTRGFMYAGSSRVLASLWSVDDRATAELMKRFYKHMISDRLSPAEALRQAQIELYRHPRWGQPYYWAGFSLQGEWR